MTISTTAHDELERRRLHMTWVHAPGDWSELIRVMAICGHIRKRWGVISRCKMYDSLQQKHRSLYCKHSPEVVQIFYSDHLKNIFAVTVNWDVPQMFTFIKNKA